jgi:DNA-binding protein Fis
MMELSLIKLISLSANDWISNMGIIFFVGVGITYVVGQYLLLKYVHAVTKRRRMPEALHMNLAHKCVTIGQYVLIAILGLVVLQMILTSSYSVVLLITDTSISYGISIVMLSLLAHRFFLWFISKRKIAILLYALSALVLALNASFTIAYVDSVLMELPAYVGPHYALPFNPFIAPGSMTALLNSLLAVSLVASFMLSWSATVLLLSYLSRRLGKAWYWTILSLPLAYFLIQFLPVFFNVFALFPQSVYPVFYIYTLFFTFSRPAGAILFGLAFWIIARRLRDSSSVVIDYMIISGIGLVLLFVSNQAIIFTQEPYPPFGIASVSFMGLSSYLVLIGVYSSAICISEDSRLRSSIRNLAMKESNLFDSIGMAQIEQEIQKKVITITRQNQERMAEETGIQSSITEEDMKSYLQEVMKEIEKMRSHHK